MPESVTKLEYIATHLAAAICSGSVNISTLGTPENRNTPCDIAINTYLTILAKLNESLPKRAA
jgi:hypothetical protein